LVVVEKSLNVACLCEPVRVCSQLLVEPVAPQREKGGVDCAPGKGKLKRGKKKHGRWGGIKVVPFYMKG